MRRHLSTVLIVIVTAAVTSVAPAVAASIADYARDADKVDGKHAVGAGATATGRAGKLVATNASGRLPDNIITKAPDAEKLDGISSGQFLRTDAIAADSQSLDGHDSTYFMRAADAAEVRPLHFMGETASETFFAPSNACTNYANLVVTVTAPGPGIVDVSGTIQLRFGHTEGTVSRAEIRIAPTTSECGPDAGGGLVWNAAELPTALYYDTTPVTRTFTIPSAGTYSYYVNGTGNTTSKFYFGRLNATYFPTG